MVGRRDESVSQTEKDKYHMTSLICEIKKDINELIYRKQIHRLQKQTSGTQGETWQGEVR